MRIASFTLAEATLTALRHFFGCLLLGVALSVAPPPAQSDGDLAALSRRANDLYEAGKFAEAAPLAQRVLTVAEQMFGAEHAEVGKALFELARIQQRLGQYREAEPRFLRALAIREKTLGPEHSDVGRTLNRLGNLQRVRGRNAEAEQSMKRAIAVLEKALGPDDRDFAESVNDLGLIYRALGRNADAEPLYERALAIRERTLGPEHRDVSESLSNLASLYVATGRRTQAEPLQKRALAIREKVLGPEHPDVASALAGLAQNYLGQARYAEAETLYKRSLAIREKALGAEHDMVATTLASTADLYRIGGRFADAEPLYKRAAAIYEKIHGPDHFSVTNVRSSYATLLRSQARYADAEAIMKSVLAAREKALGPEHPNVGTALEMLALLAGDQGRHAEAEPLFKRALAIREKSVGPEHEGTASILGNLANHYRAQGRYADAEPLFKRALAIFEKVSGPDHPSAATALNNLANLYRAQGRYADAEQLMKRALAVREQKLGAESLVVASTLSTLASLARDQGRYAEAEALLKRAWTIREKVWGADHDLVGVTLGELAELYRSQGRYAQAEPLYKQALEAQERINGPDHPWVATTLSNFTLLLREQGRHSEAEALYGRVRAIQEKAYGSDHPTLAITLNNLAHHYLSQRRFAEAEELWKRALAIQQKALGPEHPGLAVTLSSLASLYRNTGRYGEAEPLLKTALSIQEKTLGAEHPSVGTTLSNLGATYQVQERFADAEQLFQRALAIHEKVFGPDHRTVGYAVNNVAAIHFARQEWAKASLLLRRSTQMTISRQKREREAVDRGLTAWTGSEAALEGFTFVRLIKASFRQPGMDQQTGWEMASQMFELAQWARGSEAAASLAQMAAREAKGDIALSALVRERQDLLREWREHDAALIAAAGEVPGAEAPQAVDKQALRTRAAAIDARIKQIDETLVARFPEYSQLANPEPLSVRDVQQLLLPDEALVLFLDTRAIKPLPEETFVWIVTRELARAYPVRTEPGVIDRAVAQLRCGLDQTAWLGDGNMRCTNLVGRTHLVAGTDAGKLPPFDLGIAHGLYRSLLGRAEDMIKGKSLLIVPMGTLTALPFQVLVASQPPQAVPADVAAYGNAEWLITRHALSTLPSVASLKVLRQFAKPSRASEPFIGFGNPLLVGPEGTDRRAWARQSCGAPPVAPLQIASRAVHTATPKFFRSGLADVDEVRRQYPLPETTDELCAVAQLMGGSVHLGQAATERTIKKLSADGTLARARIVHFATHGLLAGETEQLTAAKAEPALILTPPGQASEEDDGLLTASEVAGLKLDADWVVLSACNTASAATDKLGAEALSGLARAFFYAGARALLVSHWAVDSVATVKLVTKSFDELKTQPRLGRARALRNSMLALIGSGDSNAHPSVWAPFVVVGEGAR